MENPGTSPPSLETASSVGVALISGAVVDEFCDDGVLLASVISGLGDSVTSNGADSVVCGACAIGPGCELPPWGGEALQPLARSAQAVSNTRRDAFCCRNIWITIYALMGNIVIRNAASTVFSKR